MLEPLCDALRDALQAVASEGRLPVLPGRQRPTVYVSLQGEMSATVMRFASQWAALVPRIKARIGVEHADVLVGIGLNFNRLDDTTSVSQRYGSSRLSWLLWQLGVEDNGDAPPIDAHSLQNLFSTVNFVGISAYAPYSGPGFELNEFENVCPIHTA
jgi:hypothetical protein